MLCQPKDNEARDKTALRLAESSHGPPTRPAPSSRSKPTKTYMSFPNPHPQSYEVARFAPSCLFGGDTGFSLPFLPDLVAIRRESNAGAFG
jgi:hypothetical protein